LFSFQLDEPFLTNVVVFRGRRVLEDRILTLLILDLGEELVPFNGLSKTAALLQYNVGLPFLHSHDLPLLL